MKKVTFLKLFTITLTLIASCQDTPRELSPMEKDIIRRNQEDSAKGAARSYRVNALQNEESKLLNTFWREVEYKNDSRTTNEGILAWLMEIAKRISNGSYSEAVNHWKNIGSDSYFQSEIFRTLYGTYPGNLEGMRTHLYYMCGSYTIANPVSDFIVKEYSR